jgi:hypothetical protein
MPKPGHYESAEIDMGDGTKLVASKFVPKVLDRTEFTDATLLTEAELAALYKWLAESPSSMTRQQRHKLKRLVSTATASDE